MNKIIKEIIGDLFKIYNSAIDAYNSLIFQTINDKYTIIDKSLVAVYLYVKILDGLNVKDDEANKVLKNYLLKQVIYSETGNLSLDVSSDTAKYMQDVLDQLIEDKFAFKNKILTRLKYSYQKISANEYTELMNFCELVSEYCILDKLRNRGNKETLPFIERTKIKLKEVLKEILSNDDVISQEKINIINAILNDEFTKNLYYSFITVVLNLKDVGRYSTLITIVKENVLFHQYLMAIVNIILAEYVNNQLDEKVDIPKIMYKSLFHDFGEYKGNEIVTQIKNYNDETIRIFAEMEKNDEAELAFILGNNLFNVMINYTKEKEGYIADLMDKILGIMKLWIEVYYMNNMIYLKGICSIYQSRFKKFKDKNRLKDVKNQDFFMDLLKESFIYIKERLLLTNKEILLTYFTEKEIKSFEEELINLKNNEKKFLED